MLLLDTNILSELRKLNSDKIHPAVQKWAEATPFSQSYISAISLTEIKWAFCRWHEKTQRKPIGCNRGLNM
jgi:PIN family toxin-antitoxin system, toxin component